MSEQDTNLIRWGIEYATPSPKGERVIEWPTEQQARDRARRNPPVRLMLRQGDGEWEAAS